MEFEDTKLLSRNCIVKRDFSGLIGKGRYIYKTLDKIQITDSETGSIIILNKLEITNLSKFIEESLNKEF